MNNVRLTLKVLVIPVVIAIGIGVATLVRHFRSMKPVSTATTSSVVHYYATDTDSTNAISSQKPVTSTTTAPQKSKSTYTAPAYKPYLAPVCTKTSIPYKTTFDYVSYLYVGQESSYGGFDGYKETCTADSTGYKPADYTSTPIDKVTHLGDKPLAAAANSSGMTYAQALSTAQSNCAVILGNAGAGDSSAMQSCIQAYLSKFGY